MPVETEFATLAEEYRRELVAHCYRMLGSVFDAEDVVQETYLRAWRGYAAFEGRSSLRTWLYRIATRACLTALQGRERRITPAGLGGPTDDPAQPLAGRLESVCWLEPLPDTFTADPATIASVRESTRLAFVAALQYLPPRQRAALLLHDVLAMRTHEVAELLDTSPDAAESALRRARARLAELRTTEETTTADDRVDRAVLSRYVEAFERSDVGALVQLLRDDVDLQMPPVPTWFAGAAAVSGFYGGTVFSGDIQRRAVPTAANGFPAVAGYRRAGDGSYRAQSIHVIETSGPKISRLYVVQEPSLFRAFGLPLTWDGAGR